MKFVLTRVLIVSVLLSGLIFSHPAQAKQQSLMSQDRMPYYLKTAALTDVPWYLLAAIDQYERNIRATRRDLPDPNGPISILFPKSKWLGPLNPTSENRDAFFISCENCYYPWTISLPMDESYNNVPTVH